MSALPRCNSAEFSWNQASCGDRRGNITGFSYFLYDDDGDLVDSGENDTAVIEINNLIYNKAYEFIVAVRTSNELGPFSGTTVTTESGIILFSYS